MPLLWVSLAFLIGIALNGFWRAPLEMWLAFTLLSAIGVWAIPGRFTTLKPSDKRIIIVSLAALLLGALGRIGSHRHQPPRRDWYAMIACSSPEYILR
ncbi:MAG: hypothetical protein HYR93_01080 [Chloroflexi bacterium]|nr:hypothetical protein [Chloroflexota bacterium]